MKLISNINSNDPSRTLTLRRKWTRDGDKRWRTLKRDIREMVGKEDVFGIGIEQSDVPRPVALSREFQFDPNPRKIERFMLWLSEQHKRGLLEITTGGPRGPEPWSNKYIRSAYQKGLADTHAKLKSKGINQTVIEGLESGFYTARHADAVGMIYTRNFKALEGITRTVDGLMSNVLAQGLSEGIGPYEMARRLNDLIEHTTGKPLPRNHPKGMRGINRSRLLARTETVRAFNQSHINEYENVSAIINEPVYVQWYTAGDERVRSSHELRHNNVYTRRVADTMIGEPNCRCGLLPYIKSVDGEVRVRNTIGVAA